MLDRTTQAIRTEEESAARRGFLFALVAYLIWGVQPLYMKAVADISSV